MAPRVDLVVVGAGIVGAGVARLAARLGLAVALVDRGDIASGTSSRSSHMVHGGLRYLEHGQVGLVREALRERAALLRMAPHLVRPARFLLPFYRGDRRPPWMVRLGLSLYDALAGAANLEPHTGLGARAARERVPALSPTGLVGGALYSDAVMDDARLALAVTLDAAEHGAEIATYTEVVGARDAGDRLMDVEARDALDGATRRWRARVVVNAAGPWADDARGRLGGARARPAHPLVRPSRGSHVVFPGGERDHGLLLLARSDGRALFVVPAGEHLLLGTTEIAAAGDPGADLPAEDEVRYLVREARRALPGAGLEPVRALGLTTGVRPLAHDGGRDLGAVPREHRIVVEGSVVHVVGGKYTTFRPMCAQALAAALGVLGDRRTRLPHDDEPLPGGDIPDFEHYLKSEAQRLETVYPEAAAHVPRLIRAHGTRLRQLLARAPGETGPLVPGLPVLAAEVRYAVEVERARRLDDVLRRRTALWLSADFGRRAAAPVAERMAALLGWDGARLREELAAWWRFAAGEERLLRAAAREGEP